VVVLEIVCLVLIGDESRDTFQHEIEMIGSPLHVGLEFGESKLPKRDDDGLRSFEDFLWPPVENPVVLPVPES